MEIIIFTINLNRNQRFYQEQRKIRKIISIDSILNQGKKTVEDLKQKGQEFGGQVLSVMEEKATQIASQSAKTVSDFVFDSTLVNILKQIEKLPKEQREKIKEEICR